MSTKSPALTASIGFLVPVIGHTLGLLVSSHFGLLDKAASSLVIFGLWQAVWCSTFGWLLLRCWRRRSFERAITIRSLALGALFSLGSQQVLINYHQSSSSAYLPLGLIALTISTYHFSEFLAIALKNPTSVQVADFVLKYDFEKDRPDGALSRLLRWIASRTYPGIEHHLALAIPQLEFVLEAFWYPELKFAFPVISFLGFTVCLGAEAIRKVAMLTAGKNFNHVVQEKHQKGHVLVTEGIYRRWRHPSYVGQYYWAIGTQLILVNPFSLVFIAVTIWLFIKQRIAREEAKLVEFFGTKYVQYRKVVPSGIPGIK